MKKYEQFYPEGTKLEYVKSYPIPDYLPVELVRYRLIEIVENQQ